MRLLIAASLCRAADPLGELAPQLTHMGSELSLAVAEHIGVTSSYRRVVGREIQERALQRLAGGRFYTELLADLNFPMIEQAKLEHAITAGPKVV